MRKRGSIWSGFLRDERGATSSEYATLIALCLVAVFPSIHYFNDSIHSTFSMAAATLESNHQTRRSRDFDHRPTAQDDFHAEDTGASSGDTTSVGDPNMAYDSSGGGTHGTVKTTDDAAPGSGAGNHDSGGNGPDPLKPPRR